MSQMIGQPWRADVAGGVFRRNAGADLWPTRSRKALPQWQVYLLHERDGDSCECVQLFETSLCHIFSRLESGSEDLQSELRHAQACSLKVSIGWMLNEYVVEVMQESQPKAVSEVVGSFADEYSRRIRKMNDLANVVIAEKLLPEWKSVVFLAKELTLSPQQIVTRLAQPTLDHDERRHLIVDAEPVSFGSEELSEILPLLREFIVRFRHSDDNDDMIAVGAALRKYMMNVAKADLSSLAVLFDPSPIAPIPSEIELELTKTLVWRLTAEPFGIDDALPEVGVHLVDLVATYLKPRLIAQKNYSAVAMNAELGLLLLRSPRVEETLALIQNLQVSWFTELIVRRAKWLKEAIEANYSPESSKVFVRSLLELESQLK